MHLRRALRIVLATEFTPEDLRRGTGAHRHELRRVLRQMWLSAEIVGNEATGYFVKEAKQ